IIKCSNIETNTFNYIEVCQVALNNSQSISSGSFINVIGFVNRPPDSFDLITDPFFSSSPLISIPAIHDTPSTYGFSGGPCFLSSNRNQWKFIGILTGASKL
ncbi:unnamed protein product, partial [Rotaria sordida]